MTKWSSFYSSFFPDEEKLEKFIGLCEQQQPPNNLAKILMHQTQRLISLADDIPKLRPTDESLQILFLLMCAENISKLYDNFKKTGKSRYYVHQFFKNFISKDDKKTLENGFIDNTDIHLRSLPLKSAVDMLYDIRCDVVHEGNYAFFHFHDEKMPIVNIDPNVNANLTYVDVRNIIVRCCIFAINKKL